jgi:AAA family ATP:ADP antiporter
VLLLALTLFILLLAYYLLKNVREALILGIPHGGAELKMYSNAAQAVVLVGISLAFSAIASRYDRLRLLTVTTLFFVLFLLVFFALFLLLPSHRLGVGVAFYIWLGCFNTSSVAALWGFAADVYPRERGERLFPIVAAGGALGAVAGAALAAPLYRHIGPFPMILVAAASLFAMLVPVKIIHRREEAYSAGGLERPRDEPIGRDSAVSLVRRDTYLLLIVVLSFVKNWVNSGGEYILDRELVAAAHAADFAADGGSPGVQGFIAIFKAHYFVAYNVLVLILQLFLVGRVLKYAGAARSLLVLPLVSLVGFSWAGIQPTLGVLFIVKVADNGVDYSLQKTAEQALYLVTSRQAKYKLKMIVDTFVVRAGDVMAAIVVWVGTALAFKTVHFIFLNLVMTVGWIGVVLALIRASRRRYPSARTRPVSSEQLSAVPAT